MKIAVIVETDHTDLNEAVRSVSNGLKRAGYDIRDYEVGDETDTYRNVTQNLQDIIECVSPAYIEAQEPEVTSLQSVRNEKGSSDLGCLVLIGLFFFLALSVGACTALMDDTQSDCYATEGAEPGSAQGMRDMERCIGVDE